jgi:hypothetical protein
MANSKPTAQTGALTLALLVKFYRSQMIALLVKNGIVVNNNASDQQITTLMANLLKVSKSFFKDLNNFISNPAVLQVITNGMSNTAQYLRATGDDGSDEGNTDEGDYQDPPPTGDSVIDGAPIATNSTSTASTSSNSGSGSSWWTGIKSNLGNYISDGIKLIGTLSTNQTNAQIAQAHAVVAQSQGGGNASGGNTGSNASNNAKTKTSTTTIVVASLVGVSIIAGIVYFVMKSKK